MAEDKQPRRAFGPGSFVWNELSTRDVKRAQTFYGSVLGWRFEPWGDASGYWIAKAGDQGVCGVMDIDKPEFGQMPCCWGYYVDVTDVDVTSERAERLGGKVLNPPVDVQNVGRMSTIQDPTGAVLNLVTMLEHATEPDSAAPGHFFWVELMTRDLARAKAFYTDLLGWKSEILSMPDGEYTLVGNEHGNAGGLMAMPSDVPMQVPPQWVGYVHVEDVDRVAAAVDEAGGHTFFPPIDISDIGRFTHVSDPSGAMLALMTPKMPGS